MMGTGGCGLGRRGAVCPPPQLGGRTGSVRHAGLAMRIPHSCQGAPGKADTRWEGEGVSSEVGSEPWGHLSLLPLPGGCPVSARP